MPYGNVTRMININRESTILKTLSCENAKLTLIEHRRKRFSELSDPAVWIPIQYSVEMFWGQG